MPRKSKTKQKQSTQVPFKNLLQPTLNDNIIICIPITAVKGEDNIQNPMTQEESMYTYNPKLFIPAESQGFQPDNAWLDGSENMSQYHPFEGSNVSDITKEKMEEEVAQTISSLHVQQTTLEEKQICMWCCHPFTNSKVHLPLQRKNDEFVVYGTFCSVECAAAYNFHDIIEFGDTWERYSLLHSLYFDSQENTPISLAPPRIALKMFGGDLSIDEFREGRKVAYSVSLAPIKYIKRYSTSTPQILQGMKNRRVRQSTQPMKTPFTFLTQR